MFRKVCVCVVFLLINQIGALKWADVNDKPSLQSSYTFKHFVSEFERSYNASEYVMRATLFEKSLHEVIQHNADPSHTYTKGINQFSDMTAAEKKRFLGYNKALRNAFRTTMPNDTTPLLPVKALPQSVDWRTKGVISPVKNQGGCGSCWAFASTESVESYVAIDGGKLLTLAPQQLVSCAPNPKHCGGTGGCEGSIAEVAFTYLKGAGMTTEDKMPYTARDSPCTFKPDEAVVSIDGYVKVDSNNYTAVMNAVATKGPLAIAVQANTWMSYSGGIFPTDGCTAENTDIDHAVQLVGYGSENGKDYWIVRNSWGAGWAEQGYIRLQRTPVGQTAPCFPDKTPGDGSGCSGGPSEVTVCGTCGILFDTCYPTGAKMK